ncbi:MAG: hypothetical protein H7Y60_07370 [Rhodospirillaceae bacterium]|nr:hypothetical protein [Rhodospirillales bacterium]
MQAVSAAPAHEMLQRKDAANNHSTRKTSSGASSAFKSYAFGPMDTKGGTPEEVSKTGLKAIQGSAALHNPLVRHSALAVTALQNVDTPSLAAAGVKTKA